MGAREEELKKKMVGALLRARQAVDQDSAGGHELALEGYNKVLAFLVHHGSAIGSATQVEALVQKYEARSRSLRDALMAEKKQTDKKPNKDDKPQSLSDSTDALRTNNTPKKENPPVNNAPVHNPVNNVKNDNRISKIYSDPNTTARPVGRESTDNQKLVDRSPSNPGVSSDDPVATKSNYRRSMAPDSLNAIPWKEDVSIYNKAFIPIAPTKSMEEKTIWLMRTLLRSMEEGAFITARIYIPKDAWSQPGIHFPGVQVKIQTLNTLIGIIYRIQEDFKNNSFDFKDEISGEFELMHKTLAKNSFIKEKPSSASSGYSVGKLSKLTSKLMQKTFDAVRGASSEDEEYIVLLKKFLETGLQFESWVLHCQDERNAKGLETIKKVLEFFSLTFLIIAVSDLNIILERYMRKSKEEFFT